MNLWDVNLWVYAFRPDAPLHETVRERLTASLDAREQFLVIPTVATSFLRLVTNPRIFEEPSGINEAWRFVDYLHDHPASTRVEIDGMTFGIFKHMSLTSGASGNSVPDVLLAAIAVRHGATLVTADRGFGRFPEVRSVIVA